MTSMQKTHVKEKDAELKEKDSLIKKKDDTIAKQAGVMERLRSNANGGKLQLKGEEGDEKKSAAMSFP